jgi:hypothetical protein
MGKKTGKTEPAKVDQVYVLGLDANGKPRGARFAELKDNIASAAMDMKCRVLIDQPEAVSALGMKLPVGRVHGAGTHQWTRRFLRGRRVRRCAAIPKSCGVARLSTPEHATDREG